MMKRILYIETLGPEEKIAFTICKTKRGLFRNANVNEKRWGDVLYTWEGANAYGRNNLIYEKNEEAAFGLSKIYRYVQSSWTALFKAYFNSL